MLKIFVSILSGSLLAQAIPILISPLLVRLYDKESIATMALVLTISNLISMINTGRLELAIMKVNNRDGLFDFFSFLLSLVFMVSLTLLVTFLVFNLFFEFKNDISIILIIGIVSVGLSIQKVALQYWLKIDKIKLASFSKTAIVTCCALLQVVLFSVPNGLIISIAISWVVAIAVLLIITKPKLISFHRGKVKRMVNTNKLLVVYELPADIINYTSNQLLYISLPMMYHPSVIAGFFLVERVIITPINLLSQAIGNVFYKKLCDSKTDAMPLTLKMMKIISLMSIIPVLIIGYYGELLFNFVFPGDWIEVSGIFLLMAIFGYSTLLTAPFSLLFVYFNKQSKLFFYSSLSLCIRFGTVLIVYSLGVEVNDVIKCFLVSSIFMRIFLLYLIFSVLKEKLDTYKEMSYLDIFKLATCRHWH